jgi:hypothetical protein
MEIQNAAVEPLPSPRNLLANALADWLTAREIAHGVVCRSEDKRCWLLPFEGGLCQVFSISYIVVAVAGMAGTVRTFDQPTVAVRFIELWQRGERGAAMELPTRITGERKLPKGGSSTAPAIVRRFPAVIDKDHFGPLQPPLPDQTLVPETGDDDAP